jgi:hypothetical protein
MKSFDQSLKYLLQHEPADFIRFALGDPSVQVLGPLPSGLPSRGRDVDGGYLIARGQGRRVAHVEFHRRHQSADDLAVDVAEAQIRFYRRERLKVLSLVWDLYGTPDQPVVEHRALDYGEASKKGGSRAVYLRVNLRGLDWRKLLAKAPPALWPLVALARQGASEEAVHRACDAIGARTDLTSAEQADHLAVLWFIAEAEKVPVQVMRAYISEGQLMASTLYQTIFKKGKAEGRTEGETKGRTEAHAETLVRLLAGWLGTVDPVLRERIRAVSNLETLAPWYEEVFYVRDAEAAQRLAEKIQKALAP